MSMRYASSRRRAGALLAVMLLALVSLALIGRGAVRRAQAAGTHDSMPGMNMSRMDMSEGAMKARSDAWFAAHPVRGNSILDTTTVIGDSLSVANFAFKSLTNGTDTVTITAGQAVLWKWVSGFHTVTSGEGSADPEMGVLFNGSMNSSSKLFRVTFGTPGVYPFFCQFHETFGMTGAVVVNSTAGVEPLPLANAGIGFVAPPFPNPSGGGASFRFALARAGHASAEVFDVRGRLVARVVDGEFGPGAYAARWDGVTRDGAKAAAGTYWMRLRVPGSTSSRRFVIVR